MYWILLGSICCSLLTISVEALAIVNPCTQDATEQKQFYHPYPPDPASYIQCTEWGTPITRRCPPGQVWSPEYVTCVNAGSVGNEAGAGRLQTASAGIGPYPGIGSRLSKSYGERPERLFGQPYPYPISSEQTVGYINPSPRVDASWNIRPPTTRLSAAGFSDRSNRDFFYRVVGWGSVSAERTPPPPQSAPPQPNPCSAQPNVRFAPHPTNVNAYYECVGTLLTERLCPADQVWSQESLSCVGTQTSGANAPVSGSGSGDSGSNSGSGAGFGSALCASDPSSYYHPYPADPSLFLQCDEFGNVYLRQCGPNKVWLDTAKTCVGRADTVGGGGGAEGGAATGGTGASGTGGATTTRPGDGGNTDQPMNIGGTGIVAGGGAVGGGGRVNVGSGGFGSWWPTGGNNPESVIVTEVFRIVCPNGYRYSIQTGICQLVADVNVALTCPTGFTWHTALNLCVQLLPSMPAGGSSGGAVVIPGTGFFPPSVNQPAPASGSGLALLTQPFPTAGTPVPSAAAWPVPAARTTASPARLLPGGIPNPCAGSTSIVAGVNFYFPYPGKPGFFIQCDVTGDAFVQPCPSGLEWNQELLTCVRPVQDDGYGIAGNESSAVAANATWFIAAVNASWFSSGLAGDPLFRPLSDDPGFVVDPCSSAEDGTYLPHPSDRRSFLQCANGMSFVRSCSHQMVWDQRILTCVVG